MILFLLPPVIAPSQISGITAFGESAITGNPGANVILTTEGGGVLSILTPSPFGAQLLQLNIGGNPNQLVIADGGGSAALAPFTAAGLGLVGTLPTPGTDAVVLISSGNLGLTISGATNTVGTPVSVAVFSGVVTTLT